MYLLYRMSMGIAALYIPELQPEAGSTPARSTPNAFATDSNLEKQQQQQHLDTTADTKAQQSCVYHVPPSLGVDLHRVPPYGEAEFQAVLEKYGTKVEGGYMIEEPSYPTNWGIREEDKDRFFLKAKSVDAEDSILNGLIVSVFETSYTAQGRAEMVLRAGGPLSAPCYTTKDNEILCNHWERTDHHPNSTTGIQAETADLMVDWIPTSFNVNQPSSKFFYDDETGLRAARSSGWIACRWASSAEVSLFALRKPMIDPLPLQCERVRLFIAQQQQQQQQDDDGGDGKEAGSTKWGTGGFSRSKMTDDMWAEMGMEPPRIDE